MKTYQTKTGIQLTVIQGEGQPIMDHTRREMIQWRRAGMHVLSGGITETTTTEILTKEPDLTEKAVSIRDKILNWF